MAASVPAILASSPLQIEADNMITSPALPCTALHLGRGSEIVETIRIIAPALARISAAPPRPNLAVAGTVTDGAEK